MKNPFFCAIATVKFGMFGFDTATRIRSSAIAGAPSRIAAASVTSDCMIVLKRLALLQDRKSAVAADLVDAHEDAVAFALGIFVELRFDRAL